MSDQDVSMFTQCLKGSSSAPVGKRVIHPDQVLQELNDVPNYQRNEEMKNTFLGDNTDVNISDSLITSVCGDGTFVQNMIDRREIYRDAENALGGPFNVFEDTFPKFTVAPGDEIELNKTPVHNVGSQGRTGEGCSTPKDMVDHTFGPLRHLDLSVVADITSHPNLPQVLTECTKTNKRANSENSVPIKRSSENFALPKSSEATFVVPKPIRRNSKHTETGTFRKNDPSTSDADPIMQINKEADSNLASDLGEMKKTNSKNFVDPVSLEPKKPAACQNLDVAKEADLGETFVLDSGDTFVVSEKLPNQALKIGSADREMREQKRKNQSILVDLHLEANSPGRIMFGSRPAKKVRELPATPVQKEKEGHFFDLKQNMNSRSSNPFRAEEKHVEHNDSNELSLKIPATLEKADIQPDVDMSTPKRNTGSQRTNIIQAVINRLHKSPSRRTCEKVPEQRTEVATPPRKDCETPTSTTRMQRARSESTSANFMKPTLSSVMRTSFNSTKSSKREAAGLRPPEPSPIMCERPMNSGHFPRFHETSKIDRSNLARVRLFPNDSQNETFESTREANLSKTRSKRISHVDADRGVENSKHDEMSCAPMPEDCEETMTDPYSSSSAMADCIDDSTSHNGASLSDTPRRAPDAKRLLTESCFTVNTPPSVHRLNFGDDDNDEKEKTDNRGATDAGTETSINDELSTLSVSDEEDGIVTIGKVIKRPKVEIILKPRELIKPTVDNDSAGLRRSTRNRMKPVRDWLGEKPVYAFSPSGNRRLLGSTSVVIHDPTLLKARSLSINVITDQQIRENAKKRNMRERRKAEALLRKARRIRELRALHKKGKNLNVTIESIVTSGSEDDSD